MEVGVFVTVYMLNLTCLTADAVTSEVSGFGAFQPQRALEDKLGNYYFLNR